MRNLGLFIQSAVMVAVGVLLVSIGTRNSLWNDEPGVIAARVFVVGLGIMAASAYLTVAAYVALTDTNED